MSGWSKWLEGLRHQLAMLALAAALILLAYFTWTMLLPWLGLNPAGPRR